MELLADSTVHPQQHNNSKGATNLLTIQSSTFQVLPKYTLHRFWVQAVLPLIFVCVTKSVFSKQYQLLLDLLIGLREEKGLSQRELSKKLKRVQTYVSKYERGERRLDVIEFLEIVKALEADPQKVIKQLLKEER